MTASNPSATINDHRPADRNDQAQSSATTSIATTAGSPHKARQRSRTAPAVTTKSTGTRSRRVAPPSHGRDRASALRALAPRHGASGAVATAIRVIATPTQAPDESSQFGRQPIRSGRERPVVTEDGARRNGAMPAFGEGDLAESPEDGRRSVRFGRVREGINRRGRAVKPNRSIRPQAAHRMPSGAQGRRHEQTGGARAASTRPLSGARRPRSSSSHGSTIQLPAQAGLVQRLGSCIRSRGLAGASGVRFGSRVSVSVPLFSVPSVERSRFGDDDAASPRQTLTPTASDPESASERPPTASSLDAAFTDRLRLLVAPQDRGRAAARTPHPATAQGLSGPAAIAAERHRRRSSAGSKSFLQTGHCMGGLAVSC